MKIQFLGTAAAEGVPAIFCDCENCQRSRERGGRNIRTRSQALIDDKILIDFPADTYMHFLKHQVPLSKIKTCIVTHSHSDHLYPAEIEMRKEGFAHVASEEPLTFYVGESGYQMLTEVIRHADISDQDVKAVMIEPFVPFEAEGYRITPLRASHAEETSPVVFVVEKGGKKLLYCHDTGNLCKESIAALRAVTKEKPLQLVSLDCTEANNAVVPYVGHLNIAMGADLRQAFLDDGIADENTVFILNHFSHNAKDVVYDNFVTIAEREGFLVSYDGMEYEF